MSAVHERLPTAAVVALGLLLAEQALASVSLAASTLPAAWAVLLAGHLALQLLIAAAPRRSPWVLALLALPALYFVGQELGAGRWISRQSWVWVVRYGVLIGAPILALWGALCLRVETRWLGVVSGALAIGALCVHHLWLPLRYTALHLVLVGLAALFAPAALRRLWRPPNWCLWPVLALGLWGGVSALRMDHHVRGELLLYSPTASTLLRGLIPHAPPPVLHRALARATPGAGALPERPKALPRSPNTRNVLLLVVDTLRADTFGPHKSARFAKVGTPNLDALAAESANFTRVYAQSTRTHRSLPQLFRSLETFEHPDENGVALPLYMRAQGRTALAVVPGFFIEPSKRYRRLQTLLDGHDQVSVYPEPEMQSVVPRALELIEGAKGRPFFAWVHLMNMHRPCFDERLLGPADGNTRVRYARALGWLDGQVAALRAGLERLGVAENTILVLASDHGEGLGEHNVGSHGPTVFEAEARVPLVFHTPGLAPVVSGALASNVDVLPTLAELMGAPREPEHRGRSLVPLMKGETLPPRDVYFENGWGNVAGLVSGSRKLIWDGKGKTLLSFDVLADPAERINLYDPHSPEDQVLASAIVRRNPRFFAKELKAPATLALLLEKLRAVKADAPGEALPFLLELGARARSAKASAELGRIFEQATDNRVRWAVVQALVRKERRRARTLSKGYIGRVSGTPAELAYVRGLPRRSHRPLGPRLLLQRLEWWAAQPTAGLDTLRPFLLHLRAHKTLSGRRAQRLLFDLLTREDPALLRLALEVAGRLKTPSHQVREAIRSLLDSPALQRLACRALSRHGTAEDLPRLEALARDTTRPIQTRQDALRAFTAIGGVDSIAVLSQIGRDPLLLNDAVALLTKLGDPAGLPFLKSVEKTHHNRYVRRRATKAREAIEGSE